jgi:predicted AAA+ superfamily ATPase
MKSKVPKTYFVSVTKTDAVLLAKQINRICGLAKALYLAGTAVPSSTVYHTLANRLVCRHDIDHVTKDEYMNHNCSFSKARNSSLMMVPA